MALWTLCWLPHLVEQYLGEKVSCTGSPKPLFGTGGWKGQGPCSLGEAEAKLTPHSSPGSIASHFRDEVTGSVRDVRGPF